MSDTESKVSQDTVSDNENNNINITVSSSSGPKLKFKITKTTPLAKVFKAYAERAGINRESVVFMSSEGEHLLPAHTPMEKGIQDGDIIEVFMKQTGGYGSF